jgi:limonene 1,2-monooxygenase
MHFGLFMMPLHPPHRAFADAYQRDVDQLVLADQLGFCEAWVGEHLTERWENAPAPDLLIAQALALTKHVKREPAPAHGAGGAPGRAPGLAGRRERDPWN